MRLMSYTNTRCCVDTGTIHDIRSIADAVHEIKGAMLCVDGVAFAPHRQIDVKELDVDIYAFSWYKVCVLFTVFWTSNKCNSKPLIYVAGIWSTHVDALCQ